MACLFPRPTCTPKASVLPCLPFTSSLSLPSSLSMVTSSLSSRANSYPIGQTTVPLLPPPTTHITIPFPPASILEMLQAPGIFKLAGILQGLQEPPVPRSEQQVDTVTCGRNSD